MNQARAVSSGAGFFYLVAVRKKGAGYNVSRPFSKAENYLLSTEDI